MKKERIKKNNKIQKAIHSERGITLIALVITIIVLIILAGISISLVLGQNGLFNKAKSAATETAKARFIEDAGFAYSEAYIEKVETSNTNDITIGDVVAKLKSSYGYTNEQIKTITSGVSSITLSETEITLEPGETKDVTVELENGTYYALIEGLYYPITLSNGEITLGNGVAILPEGDGTTNNIEAAATEGGDLVEVTVDETKITIKAKDELEESGEATVTVTYGKSISKEIKVKIKVEVKQGDEVLGKITVTLNDSELTLAQGWKYFCEDGDNVWLIYSGILEAAAQQVGGTIQPSGNYVKSSKNRDDLISYLNGTESYAGKWDHIKTGIKEALKGKNITVQDSEIEVKGSPDIELFQKAYDQMYPDENFKVQKNNIGWQYSLGETENFVNQVSISDWSTKPLFFIGSNYWLASPSASFANSVCDVSNGSSFISYRYDGSNFGARPVVSIPASAFNQLIN